MTTLAVKQASSSLLRAFVEKTAGKVWPFMAQEMAVVNAMALSWRPVYKELKERVAIAVDFDNPGVTGHRILEMDLKGSDVDELIANGWKSARGEVRTNMAEAYAIPFTLRPGLAKVRSKKSRVAKIDEDLLDLTVTALVSHLEQFYRSNHWRLVSPEVLRLVDWLYANPDARLADITSVVARIDRMLDATPYFHGLGSVGVSRSYQFGFLDWAQEIEVEKYMVLEVLDERTCPVCVRMHGKMFSVVKGQEIKQQYLDVGADIDQLKQLLPFPKLRDVDNKSTEDLGDTVWCQPPFHPMCRGQLIAVQ